MIMAKRITVLLLVGAFVVAVLAPSVAARNWAPNTPPPWAVNRITTVDLPASSADDGGWNDIESAEFRWPWDRIAFTTNWPGFTFWTILIIPIDAGADTNTENDRETSTNTGSSSQ